MLDYLDHLDQTQQIAFLTGLAHIAHADGSIDEDETAFISAIGELYGILPAKLTDICAKDETTNVIKKLKQIKKPTARLALIREMFYIGHADGELTDDEILTIADIGEALDISIEKMEKISQWVIDGLVWQEKGAELFADL